MSYNNAIFGMDRYLKIQTKKFKFDIMFITFEGEGKKLFLVENNKRIFEI